MPKHSVVPVKQTTPKIIQKADIIIESIKPLLTICSFVGIIPRVKDHHPDKLSKIKYYFLKFIVPLMVIATNMADSVCSIRLARLLEATKLKSTTDVVISVGSNQLAKLSLTFLILVSLSKSNNITFYLKKWREVNQIIHIDGRSLKIRGWTLTIIMVVVALTYDGLQCFRLYQEITKIQKVNLVCFSKRVFICAMETIATISWPFLGVIFVKALSCGYQDIAKDLENVLRDKSNQSTNQALEDVRRKYQTMEQLVEATNRLLNPSLCMILVVTVIHLCSDFYSIAKKLMYSSFDMLMANMIYFAVFRILLIGSICFHADDLVEQVCVNIFISLMVLTLKAGKIGERVANVIWNYV